MANYFGVGAYLRPLEDARRAEVRFASECLAFANVPDEDPTDRTVGVMKDAGADWDFADVRDHYLRLLHGVGPDDPGYWDYARFATGEVMAAVFGEWRRAASPCTGGIILWLRDLVQGAGWGLLDAEGRPKVAWHVLRRALAPVAVWIVDEGLNGLSVHVANDGPERVRGSLRVACYRHGRVLTASAEEAIELAPHSQIERDAEAMLGGFVDVTYAYRFGEPQQDVVVLSLERDGELLSEAFHYPVTVDVANVGAESLRTHVLGGSDETIELVLESAAAMRGIRLGGDGLVPSEDAFDLAPGSERRIRIRRLDSAAATLEIRALDLSEPLTVSIP